MGNAGSLLAATGGTGFLLAACVGSLGHQQPILRLDNELPFLLLMVSLEQLLSGKQTALGSTLVFRRVSAIAGEV